MSQFEQSTVPADSTAAEHVTLEHDDVSAERTGRMPLIAVLIALAFAASAWFFYHQGQRDAALATAAAQTSIMDDVANDGSAARAASNSGDRASATTAAQSASDDKPDIIVTVHPTAAQMRAPVAKRMLAKATKPASAPVVATMPIDRQVALASHPQPVYPLLALRAHEQGTVLVLAQVDVNGHVSDARIVRHSGSSILDRAAPNEVRHWQFEPALHNGQPIVASIEVPISYRIGQ